MRKGGVLRPRPSDFWTTYVEVGRVGCIEHYRTHRTVVERWADEVGKVELRKARADYVAECKERVRGVVKAEPASPDPLGADPDDVAAACAYFREPRNGAWVCAINERGMAFRGSRVMQPAELVELAREKGMDEWYVEADIMKRYAMHADVDEWVLENDATRDERPVHLKRESPYPVRPTEFRDNEYGFMGRENVWFEPEPEGDFYAPRVSGM